MIAAVSLRVSFVLSFAAHATASLASYVSVLHVPDTRCAIEGELETVHSSSTDICESAFGKNVGMKESWAPRLEDTNGMAKWCTLAGVSSISYKVLGDEVCF